jgi:hypothetical protein
MLTLPRFRDEPGGEVIPHADQEIAGGAARFPAVFPIEGREHLSFMFDAIDNRLKKPGAVVRLAQQV